MQKMTVKEQILADLKDLISTLYHKKTELRDDANFRAMWGAKNIRLHNEVKLLTPEETLEVEKEYREWMVREFPEVQFTPSPITE